MLTPKFASDGFYLNDKLDIFEKVKNYVLLRYPEHGERAEREMIEFVSKMSDLPPTKKQALFKLSAQEYWTIFGRKEFPTLNLCAKEINSMICSSASSERAWSIFRFLHNRLRNRLSKEKVEQLVFIYTNSSIIEKNDDFDYEIEAGADINGKDYVDT
jgi:hAT family C-terminal dimerisation region